MILAKILTALVLIESGGDVTAHNVSEDAVGILQIRPIMVREVNRILDIQGADGLFKLSDRWDAGKSRRMCTIFLMYQKGKYIRKCGVMPSDMQLAMSWNTGGIFKRPSKEYGKKLIEQGEVK